MDYSAAGLRAKNKEKAKQLAGGSDYVNEASSFRQGNAMDNDAPTGMRPLGRQNRKDGGLVKELVNRDVKDANDDRPGKKHIGGMKKGGMVDSDDHPKGCKCKACGGAVSMAGVPSGGREERKSGGRTNINIIIQPNEKKPQIPMMPADVSPPMGPPPGIGAPPPMGGLPGPGVGPIPGGGAPPMMRASGGAVNKDVCMTHGSGGGLGRLEKIRKYGSNARSGETK